jgi:hypothetical protein
MTNVLQSPNINLNIIIFEKLNSKKKKLQKYFKNIPK